MLKVLCTEYFNEQWKWAEANGLLDIFKRDLDQLKHYGCSEEEPELVRCDLHWDFAPHSFTFVMFRRQADGIYDAMFNGGFIYSGPEQPLDGSFPALTCSLAPLRVGWSMHT